MPIPPKSIPSQKRNIFARRAARAPGQNQVWQPQPRAILAKSGYVTKGCSSLTQHLKQIFSSFFPHADSSEIDSRPKRKLFCALRRARAWAISVLASPAQGQIWVCHLGYLSLTQNFKPVFFSVFQHVVSTAIDSRSKQKLFCAPRGARAWAKSVLASPAQGHSSEIWVCHQGYPSVTQYFKPIFSYIFHHADSARIDSRSKQKLFYAPRRAPAWAKSILASRAEGHSSQIWVCHGGVPQFDPEFQTHLFPLFSAC